jgi:hypothetical protein
VKAKLVQLNGDCREPRGFTLFSPKEIRQHFAICLFQGLCPSPDLEAKFCPTWMEPLYGNDFVHECFGGLDGTSRHLQFRRYLALQDPLAERRSPCPYWKIEPLLKKMNHLFPEIWELGEAISLEARSTALPSCPRDTKGGSGRVHCFDGLFQDGFCYQLRIRDDHRISYNTGLSYFKMSPQHIRCMLLFDSLKDCHHKCTVKNSCFSAAFCRAAYNHKKKVLCHGRVEALFPVDRGVPKCVLQKQAETRNEQRFVRGTMKAAVVEGDSKCPNLVASSIYDKDKPLHYLSMASEKIRWVVNKSSDSGSNKNFEHQSLRLASVGDYGTSASDFDSDSKSLDRSWLKHRKWWWSVAFSAIELMLNNAYIVYVRVNEEDGVDKKEIMPKSEFLSCIIDDWMRAPQKGDLAHEDEEVEKHEKVQAPSPTGFVVRKRKYWNKKHGNSETPDAVYGRNCDDDDASALTENSNFSSMEPEVLYKKKKRGYETPDSRRSDHLKHVDATRRKLEETQPTSEESSTSGLESMRQLIELRIMK